MRLELEMKMWWQNLVEGSSVVIGLEVEFRMKIEILMMHL